MTKEQLQQELLKLPECAWLNENECVILPQYVMYIRKRIWIQEQLFDLK